jgi:hypothetical protein
MLVRWQSLPFAPNTMEGIIDSKLVKLLRLMDELPAGTRPIQRRGSPSPNLGAPAGVRTPLLPHKIWNADGNRFSEACQDASAFL